MRSVLLLRVYLFAIHKIVAGWDRRCSLHTWLSKRYHRTTLHINTVIIHFEELHLLSCDGWAVTVRMGSLVHHGEPHRARHEYIISCVVG